MNILSSIPIWPIHSCQDKFIDAKSGIPFPFKLRFFSFRKDTTFYKCEDELDFNTLRSMNAKTITELKIIYCQNL